MSEVGQLPASEKGEGVFPERVERRLFYFTFAISLVLLTVFVFQPAEILVRYLSDDAYYYFQVARHISDGHGPTFDGVTWTTGFHPLYALVLVLIDQLFEPTSDGFVACALGFGALCFFLTGILVSLSAKTIWSKRAGLWAGILWFSNPNAILLVATGMEGSVYAASLALLLFLTTRVVLLKKVTLAQVVGSGLILGSSAALCVLARTDALVFVGMIGLYLLLIAPLPTSKRFIIAGVYGVFAMLPILLWFWYCADSTGDALQGSAEMKTITRHIETEHLDSWGKFLFGCDIFVVWVQKSVFKIPILKFIAPFFIVAAFSKDILRSHKAHRPILHSLWIALCLLGIAYALFLPKAWTWYYAPNLVFLTLLSSGCMYALCRMTEKSSLQKLITRIMPILLLITAVEAYGYLLSKSIRGRNRYQTAHLQVARWAGENLPPDARIAAWNSGIISWHSGLQTINLDGLINNEVPELIAKGGRISTYIRRAGIKYVADDSWYMELHCPEWTARDYALIYQENEKSVWEILSPPDPQIPSSEDR